MKIRGKLLVAIFSIISSFILVFLFIIILGIRILSFKNLENYANIAVANMYKLNNQTRKLLISNEDLNTLNNDWNMAIKDFEDSFIKLMKSGGLRNLSNNVQRIQESTNNIWLINRVEFSRTSELLTNLYSNKVDILQGKSILQFYWESEHNNNLIKEFYTILPLKQQLDSVQNKSIGFLWVLEGLREEINNTVGFYLSISLIISFVIVLLIIIGAIFYGSFFSNRLANKIMLVESSLYAISRGDFTKKLDIEGSDEFGQLSKSFNELMSNLWKKIYSVMEFMRKVGSSQKTEINIEHSLNTIIKAIVVSLKADSGVVLLKNNNINSFRVAAREGIFPPPIKITDDVKEKKSSILNHLDSMTIDTSNNAFAESFFSRETIFIRDNYESGEYKSPNSEEIFNFASIIISPLFLENEVIGVIAVFRRKRDDLFSELDLSYFKTFIDYTSLVLENISQYSEILKKKEIEVELNIAKQIQQELLSVESKSLPGIEMETFSKPAKEVGGDYFNIKNLDKNTLAVLICDVSGKGVPAAMIMIMIHSAYNFIASINRTPAEILKLINQYIVTRTSKEYFASMQYFAINNETLEVRFANAAHFPLLIYRNAKKAFVNVDAEGFLIGIEKSVEYKQVKFTLNKGDLIILYTDGIIEAKDNKGNLFGVDRLKKSIQNSINKSISDIKKNVIIDLNNFVGSNIQHDDQTLILLRV